MIGLKNPPTTDFDSPEHQARLDDLYRDVDAVGMTPLRRTREVPAWSEFSLQAAGDLDLFTFSDAPVLEKLRLLCTQPTEGTDA